MSLSSRSMYVSLSQRIWQAQSADRSLAQNIEVTTEAHNRTMKVLKQLAPTDYLLPIRRMATYGRAQHERLTLPGLQKGQQLLATKLFDQYILAQAEIREAFEREVNRFCDIYPDIVEKAPQRLGKAFRANDFPMPERIKSFFSYDIRFNPVPDSGNWLLDDVDTEELDKLRNAVDNEKNDMFREATKELFDRTVSVLDNLATQAKNYAPNNGGMLREATINSVKDLAGLLSSMNITGDPAIEATAREMQEKFCDLDAREMRQNEDVRNNIKQTAERLIAKMKGLQG